MSKLRRVTFTPTISTDIYAANDVLFATVEVPGVLPKYGGTGILRAIAVHDADDEGSNITFYFLRSNVALGTINEAISITDANAKQITGAVLVDSWFDLIGSQMGLETDLWVPLEGPGSGSKSIYVAATIADTPTFAAATNIVVDLWIEDQP